MADNNVDYVATSIGVRIKVPKGITLREGRASDLESIWKLSTDMNRLDGGDYMPGMKYKI